MLHICTKLKVGHPMSFFLPINFHLGEFFKIHRTIQIFDSLLFFKAFAYFNYTKNEKKITA
jgi:hypothetical protein